MAENNAMNVRIVDGDDCCPQAMCVKVCNLVQEVRKTGASKKLIPSEKAVSDALKGRQELLVAGAADGILGPSAATGLAQVLTAPSAGVSIVDAIKGRTLKWNQLAVNGDHTGPASDIELVRGTVTITDGVATYDNDTMSVSFGRYLTAAGTTHKYFVNAIVRATAGENIRVGGSNTLASLTLTANTWTNFAAIVTGDGSRLTLNMVKTSGLTFDTKYEQCIDLTDMFGSGNEPSTVAEFEALFPESYYAYNPGTLLPFKGTALKVTGQNQWNEQWEMGVYDSTGAKIDANDAIRSSGKIAVFPGTDYYGYCGVRYTNGIIVRFYDIDGVFISSTSVNNQSFTTPANCHFLAFCSFTSDNITTYNNDICINLSNAALNGTYKPYTETLVNIDAVGKSAKDGDGNAIVPFPTGVNGVGTVLDVYDKDGGTKVLREVDMGDLYWQVQSDNRFLANLENGASINNFAFISDSKYTPTTASGAYNPSVDGVIWAEKNSENSAIRVRDSSFNGDATAFRASVVGRKLVYELATPVPFTWDEPFTLAFTAEEGGTIWLQPEGVDEEGVPVSAPLNADIAYTVPAGQVINATTLDNLLTALKTAGIITAYTMTADGSGNYTFTITA